MRASRQVDPGGLDAGVLEDGLPARVLAVAGVAEATEGHYDDLLMTTMHWIDVR